MNEVFGEGWKSLEDLLNEIVISLPFAKIQKKYHRFGMLCVEFVPLDNPAEQYILQCIAYKLERDSALLCERCGSSGRARKDLDPRRVLCLPCYAITLSDASEKEQQETMFWTNEDLDELAPTVKSIFGEQGSWMNTKPELIGLAVTSTKYGKLWYGDVSSMDDLVAKCVLLKEHPQFQGDSFEITRISDDESQVLQTI